MVLTQVKNNRSSQQPQVSTMNCSWGATSQLSICCHGLAWLSTKLIKHNRAQRHIPPSDMPTHTSSYRPPPGQQNVAAANQQLLSGTCWLSTNSLGIRAMCARTGQLEMFLHCTNRCPAEPQKCQPCKVTWQDKIIQFWHRKSLG